MCISFSRTESGLRKCHLVVWSNFNFLHNSQWITFPVQLCQVLYSFCTYSLHLPIMWLIVLSLLPHKTYICYFFCILSIFALTKFVLMTMFCAAIKKDSVSLLRFSFLSHVQVYSYEIFFVCCLKYPYSCLSSHFYFLVIVVLLILVLFVLFLVTVICLSLFFLCNLWVIILVLSLILVSPLSSFLDTYSLSISFLECKAFISSLVFLLSSPCIDVLPLATSRMVLSILKEGQPWCYPFDEIFDI